MEHGFIRVAAAIPSVRVADVDYNLAAIEQQILEAENKNVEIIVFPELSITGYTCQDLFLQQTLIKKAEEAVVSLADFSADKQIVIIVGLPVDTGKLLLNCAAVVSQGKLISLVPKTYLPNYGEFYEKRWFASSQNLNDDECFVFAGCHISNMKSSSTIFETPSGVRFGIEICEDLWAPTPPSNHLSLAGADLIFNLSATDEMIGKHDYLTNLISQQSARTISGYIYSSCGFGESTQDVVYGGNAFIFENGSLLAESERFSFNPQLIISEIDIERLRYDRRRNTTFTNAQRGEKCKLLCHTGSADTGRNASQFSSLAYRKVNPYPFIPQPDNLNNSCDEILNIQIAGLAKRLIHTNCKKVVVGISGGLDSTLALLVCVKTFDKLSIDRKDIIGVTMPGFGTTDRTYTNAVNLMKSLRITIREISIVESVVQHFKDIDHDVSQHDVTYENSQARERTQILMDLANKLNAMVIGTGDMSELALGWATYNGDHMSMYGVNAGIPKTLIKYLVRFVANCAIDSDSKATLLDIIDTPISPELIPANADGTINQRTEDLVGPYDLHDFFLYYMLRFGYRPSKIKFLAQKAFEGMFSNEVIDKWLKTFCRRFFSQQFKRSCLPDGPKVGSISLSPRGDWRMPSDASSCLWLSDCER